jgi:hypothetical protein
MQTTNYGVGHHVFVPLAPDQLPIAVRVLLECPHPHRFEVRKEEEGRRGTGGVLVSSSGLTCLQEGYDGPIVGTVV